MLPQDLILVDIRVELWNMRNHRCKCRSDFRTPAYSSEECIRVVGKVVASLPGAVFQNKGHTTRRTDSRDSRRSNGHSRAVRNYGETLIQSTLNSRRRQIRGVSVVPLIQTDEEEGCIGVLGAADQVQAIDCSNTCHAWHVTNDRFGLNGSFNGTLQRGSLRQL